MEENQLGADKNATQNAAQKSGQRHHWPPPDSAKVRILSIALLVIVSLSFGFLGGRLALNDSGNSENTGQQQIVLEEQGDLIREIAQDVGESVVSVTPTRQVDGGFFLGAEEREGAGTGIILDKDGLIMTNRHVVSQGTVRVDVTLSDGTEFEDVEILGRTTSSDTLDVAFLQIGDTRGKELNPAKLGDSSKMRVGDSVIAIGNALGQYQNTVTSGIISGYGRDVQAANRDGSEVSNLENVFQTDAAINAGNSGGPLVNLKGEVIGLNTAAVIEGAQDIGFAIPINDLQGLVESVIATGKFERPFLGVYYISLTNDVAEYYELDVNRGAYIPSARDSGGQAILEDSPAQKAGLKEGDIITHFGDTAVNEDNSLAALINRRSVGDKVSLTVLRGGEEIKIDATLGAAPTE